MMIETGRMGVMQSQQMATRSSRLERSGPDRARICGVAMLMAAGCSASILLLGWQSDLALPFSVSSETTCFTEPLQEDGQPDFLAAINNRLVDSVTLQNNAAVLLLPLLPMDGDDPRPLLASIGVELKEVEIRPLQGLPARLKGQFDKAVRSGWTRDKFPELFEWVQSNNYAFPSIREAANREYYYVPLQLSDTELVGGCLLADVQSIRQVGRLLIVQATLNIGEGELHEAVKGIQSIRRLGDQLANGSCLVMALTGMSLHDQACDAMAALVSSQVDLMDGEWSQLEEAWGKRTRILHPDVIGICERAIVLDAVCYSARNGSIDDVVTFFGRETEFDFIDDKIRDNIRAFDEWDEVLAATNQLYSDLLAAWETDDVWERKSAIAKMVAVIEHHKDVMSDQANGNVDVSMSELLIALSSRMSAFLDVVYLAELERLNEHRIVRLGLAIRRFEQNEGQFPDTLEALRNDKQPRWHVDLISGKPYQYEVLPDGFTLYTTGSDQKVNSDDDTRLLNRDDTDDWGIVYRNPD